MGASNGRRLAVAFVAISAVAILIVLAFAFRPGLPGMVPGVKLGAVAPTVETEPSRHSGDTADDMAIWIHPTDPAQSLVIGDDKDGGLMVWDLTGRELQYVEGTGYNNLDLRYNFPLAGVFTTGDAHATVALVAVGDEGQDQIDFFKVNPATRQLEAAGSVDVPMTPYGGCMYRSETSGAYYFVTPDRDGLTRQWELRDGGGGLVTGTQVREFEV